VITYDHGSTEHRRGNLFDPSEPAIGHGLSIVPTPDDTFRWDHLRPPRTRSRSFAEGN